MTAAARVQKHRHAADAYMRGYEIIVPSDYIISMNEEGNRVAIEQMKETVNAVISISDKLLEDVVSA